MRRLTDEPLMITIRLSTPRDAPRLLDIWRRAVDATHHFLAPGDRRDIEADVVALIPRTPFEVALDEHERMVAFRLLDGSHLAALFVDPQFHGRGVGRALVEDALRRHAELSTDVNEQNLRARGFYEHLGFEPCGYSENDGLGRPYPLIHLRLKARCNE